MAQRIYPHRYLEAATIRIDDAQVLYDQHRFALALYVAGVSAECVLRAYRTLDEAQFDERHDLRLLWEGCSRRRFDRHRPEMDTAIEQIRKRWDNDWRYSSADLILTRFRKQYLHQGISGDPVKAHAKTCISAAHTILRIGSDKWP